MAAGRPGRTRRQNHNFVTGENDAFDGFKECSKPMARMNLRKSLIPVLVFGLAFHTQAQAIETGHNAPNCKVAPLSGGPSRDLQQYRGKVVYVDFWASWCGPCAQSFSFMNGLGREFTAKGLSVVGINLDENREDAKAFLEKHAANFTVVADESGQCPQEFGVTAMPSSYLIDRDGVVRYIHLGFRPGEAGQFRAKVEELLAGR